MIFFKEVIVLPRVRMLIAGAISTCFAYATFLLFIFINMHYQLASVLSFLAYLSINFTLHKNWSFKSTGDGKIQAVAHLCLHLANQLVIMAGLYVLVEWFALYPAWSQLAMQTFTALVVFVLTPIIFGHRKLPS